MADRFKVLHRMKTVDTIPWSVIAPHERQAMLNHYQSLSRLNERGGLSWSEMLAVLEDRPWRQMDPEAAREAVLAIVKNSETGAS